MKALKLYTLILFMGLSVMVKGQSDILYFMNETPQSSFINPAFGVKLGNYISIPVLSEMAFDFHTSGFCYHDIINQHPVYKDSLRIDANGFYEKLKKSNSLNFTNDISIFGIGLGFGKNHLSFDVRIGFSTRIGLEKSLLGFILYGTDSEDKGLVYDEPLLDISMYLSPSLSFAREFGDKLSVGIRAGMLFGIFDFNTIESKVSIANDNNMLKIQSNIDILTSNAIGQLSSESFLNSDVDFLLPDGNIASVITGNIFKNKGASFDLGATYKIREDMQLSFAVTDLGFIHWQTNATAIRSCHPNHTVEFRGVESTLDSLSNDLEAYVSKLGDTLNYIFDMRTEDIGSYVSMIPAKFYLGYTWKFFGASYIHALYKGVKGNGYFDNYFSIFYGLHWKALAFSFGNTFSNSSALQPALALSITGFGFNIYCGGSVSLVEPTFNIADMSGIKIYAGVNFVINRKNYWQPKILPL
ncbi:MAG: DUF5723 family protein [Bacteroidales bacterium]|jgi:hypothetical protein|nr:DUF5723 family protein [Bacteroidales bacterium]